jgi:hypothetical protein
VGRFDRRLLRMNPDLRSLRIRQFHCLPYNRGRSFHNHNYTLHRPEQHTHRSKWRTHTWNCRYWKLRYSRLRPLRKIPRPYTGCTLPDWAGYSPLHCQELHNHNRKCRRCTVRSRIAILVERKLCRLRCRSFAGRSIGCFANTPQSPPYCRTQKRRGSCSLPGRRLHNHTRKACRQSARSRNANRRGPSYIWNCRWCPGHPWGICWPEERMNQAT